MLAYERKKILVIIPAYNEEASIPFVIKSLKLKYPAFSVVVIDDGSKDLTASRALSLGAFVVSLPFNLGIGGAVQTGFKYAKENNYDFVIQFDADGQHDTDCVEKILKPVYNGELDICIGSRFISNESLFKSTMLRRMGIKFFAFFISLLTGQLTTDPTSGFRAFGRSAINLFAEYYPIDFPEPESIAIARHNGLKIGEAAVIMHPRRGGVSSIRYLKSAYYMVKVTLAIFLCFLRKKRRIG